MKEEHNGLIQKKNLYSTNQMVLHFFRKIMFSTNNLQVTRRNHKKNIHKKKHIFSFTIPLHIDIALKTDLHAYFKTQ